MQIILISKNKKDVKSWVFGKYLMSIVFLFSLSFIVIVFYGGSIYALDKKQENAIKIAPSFTDKISNQQKILVNIQENAKKNLDILATRLSKLQAHIMRLDALGGRLADMADLQEIKFNIESPLGLGGPEPAGVEKTIRVDEFFSSLEKLDLMVKDRSEKLEAIESILMDRTLQNKTLPKGSPVEKGWVSSLFGVRTDPITGKLEKHEGIDYVGKEGEHVLAVASGIVIWSGYSSGYGNMVKIGHGNGYQTVYAHNKKNLVSVGGKVEKGQNIALLGSTGRVTGPHVHFEVIYKGKRVDPRTIISLN